MNKINNTIKNQDRITPLWAFNESAFGGTLHIFNIPLKGIIISNFAVLLISLLAEAFKEKGKILKSTLSVLIVKWTVAPHTPLTAYFAVAIQGLMGELVYFNGKVTKIRIFLFALFISIITGFQKVIILTILYGNTLWKSIDELINSALKFFFLDSSYTNFSLIIILAYVSIHLAAGVLNSFYIMHLIKSLKNYSVELINELKNQLNLVGINESQKKKRKKISIHFIIIFSSLIVVLFSYFVISNNNDSVINLLFMIIRAVTIIILWYFVIGPLIRKWANRFFEKKQMQFGIDAVSLINQIPSIKATAFQVWNGIKSDKGIKKYFKFLTLFLLSTILIDKEIN